MPYRVLLFAAVVAAPLAAAAQTAPQSDPVAGIQPVRDSDFYEDNRFAPEKVELGRLLFFDKILSGNKNIACGTCHHPTGQTRARQGRSTAR